MTKARTLADNFAADINGITAGTGITGGGTSGTVTITNDMATTIDAKGDLVVGTGADTYDNLAAGANGETLVADSSAAVGLRYNPLNVLANPVINGGMDVWQRGTSFTPSAGTITYCADRWVSYRAVTGYTVSRQTTSDTTNLPSIQYSLRLQRTSGNTALNPLYINQSVETANALPFAGKTITMSFYARAGADFSATSSRLSVEFYTGTGTDQNVNAGYTNAAAPLSVNATLTTTWQRFAYTVNIGSTITEFAPYFHYTPTGTAGTNDWAEITGVQIDFGTYTASSAPSFRRSGGTLAGEFAAAQRYFVAYGGNQPYEAIPGWGNSRSTVTHYLTVPYPPMRTTPSFSVSAVGDWEIAVSGLTSQVCTAITLSTSESGSTCAFLAATTASNANLGGDKPVRFVAKNTTAARMFFSAEL